MTMLTRSAVVDYLVLGFEKAPHASIGGPTCPRSSSRWSHNASPKRRAAPLMFLLSDDVAEHIPGCNMAFRKECLRELEDSISQSGLQATTLIFAGESKSEVGRSGSARRQWFGTGRRASVVAYWKQQKGYGRAETC